MAPCRDALSDSDAPAGHFCHLPEAPDSGINDVSTPRMWPGVAPVTYPWEQQTPRTFPKPPASSLFHHTIAAAGSPVALRHALSETCLVQHSVLGKDPAVSPIKSEDLLTEKSTVLPHDAPPFLPASDLLQHMWDLPMSSFQHKAKETGFHEHGNQIFPEGWTELAQWEESTSLPTTATQVLSCCGRAAKALTSHIP